MVYEGTWWELFFPAPDQWCPHADSTAVHVDQALVAVFSCAFSDSVYGKAFSCIRSILETYGLCGTGDTSWCPCNTVFAMSCLVVFLHKHWLEGVGCFSEKKVLQACPGLHRVLPLNGYVKAALFFRCHSTFSGGRRPRGSGWCRTARGDPRRNHRWGRPRCSFISWCRQSRELDWLVHNNNAAKPLAGMLCSWCVLLSSPRPAEIIPSLQLSSCLPHPEGNSQPFLLSFSAPHLTVFLSGVSVVASPPISRLSAYLQIPIISAALPAAPLCWQGKAVTAGPCCLSHWCSRSAQPMRLSLKRQVKTRPLQQFCGCRHVLRITQRKWSG